MDLVIGTTYQTVASSLEYMQFLARFGKSLSSTAEFESRFSVFSENLKQVNLHNSKHDSTFKMAINQYSDLTPDEFMQLTTTKIPLLS